MAPATGTVPVVIQAKTSRCAYVCCDEACMAAMLACLPPAETADLAAEPVPHPVPKWWCVHCAYCGMVCHYPAAGYCIEHSGEDCPGWRGEPCIPAIVVSRMLSHHLGIQVLPDAAVDYIVDEIAMRETVELSQVAGAVWEVRHLWLPHGHTARDWQG